MALKLYRNLQNASYLHGEKKMFSDFMVLKILVPTLSSSTLTRLISSMYAECKSNPDVVWCRTMMGFVSLYFWCTWSVNPEVTLCTPLFLLFPQVNWFVFCAHRNVGSQQFSPFTILWEWNKSRGLQKKKNLSFQNFLC